MEEKRNFVRVQGVQDIRFRVKGQDASFVKVGVKNISLQGISILRTPAMAEGTVLELLLELSGNGGPVPISGAVMWQLPDGRGMFSTGIQFQAYDALTREQLSKFIMTCARRVEEKREFVRCALDVRVRYGHAGETGRFAQSVDISRGGMKVLVSEPLAMGTRLTVTFALPDDQAALTCAAEVVWVQPGDTAIHRIGLQFLDISPRDADRIWTFVSRQCGDAGTRGEM